VTSVADGPPSIRQVELLSSFAGAFSIHLPEVRVMTELAFRHMWMFRFDFYRRSHLRGMLEEQLRRSGLWGGLHQIAAFRGLAEDRELAARYRSLGKLPEDTFGYAFFRHCVDNEFAFPGEPHGFPEGGIYHDFSHVLSGYGVTSEEEMLVTAFIAGFRKENPSFVLLFAMLTFGAGINMTPIPQPSSRHILATPGLADRFFRALERGTRLKQDLSVGWEPWDLVALPLDEVRQRLGIEPESTSLTCAAAPHSM
jgi:ubiquinone biosynthesis protein Coq4